MDCVSTIDDAKIHEIVERVVNQVMGAPQMTAPVPEKLAAKEAAPASPPSTTKGQLKVVVIGADHGGFVLKETLKPYITELGFEVQDMGTYTNNPVDYPDFAHDVASRVSTGKAWRGIMIDGAGIGSCIVANKVPGVRAGMAYDYSSALNSREHNDTNVLTLGAGLIGVNLAKLILKTWLTTDFGGGRHQPRIDKISAVEKKYFK
jgi:ribose 5-phosphate isomerase B